MILTGLLALALAAAPVPEPPVSDRTPSPGHSPDFVGARDGEVAVREEFEAAAKANTVAAWNLFIARHPDSPLVPQAQAERRRLLAETP